MSFTQTPNYNLYKPTINSDNDQWGTHLNANADTLDAALVSVAAPANDSIGRNKLHNPLMNVAQRGTGPWTANGYTVDRWTAYANLDTISFTQQALADTDRTAIGDEAALYALRNVFTGNAGAAAQNTVAQPIENVRRLSGKTVIVSFWAQASAALKLGATLGQNFGSGGSPSPTVYLSGQSATLSTTWARYNLTFTLASAAGKTFGTTAGTDLTQLVLAFSSGANNNAVNGNIGVQSGTVQLWGVQLEVAQAGQTQPSPLEKPDPRYDLSNCQRFYQTGWVRFGGYATAGGYLGQSVMFPVVMRGSPSFVVTNSASTNCSPYAESSGPSYGSVWGQATATGMTGVMATYIASADL